MAEAFLDWLAALPTVAMYAILMALSALENVFPPVPADVAVALGAFLAQRGETSAVLIGLLCWLANTASAAGMFFVGRAYGETFFKTGWPSKLLPPPAMKALADAFERHGIFGIFVSRFLPGVRAAVTPFAGVVKMHPARALIPAAIASGLWYAAIVAVGTTLGLNWDGVRRVVERANVVLGVLGLLAAAWFVWWLWRRTRRPPPAPPA